MPTRSMAGYLHGLQKDVGLSDKELKQAVKRYATPKEVKLPTFKEKATKAEKKQSKILEPGNKKRKYKAAYWYLEEYLKPSEANRIYMEHTDFKELVDYAYQMVLNLVQLQNFIVDEDPPAEKLIKEVPTSKYDIPKDLEKEFREYAKKHPLKSAEDIIPRRQKFQKYRRKRRAKLYSKRNMRMYDPLFAHNSIDAKEMLKNLERIGRENELRVKRFHELLDSLVVDKSIGSKAMEMFDKRTETIMKQHEKRVKEFARQAGLKPNPAMFDLD